MTVQALLLLPGAVREVQIFRRDSGDSFVVVSAEVVLPLGSGFRVKAAWSRPPTPDELAYLDEGVENGSAREQLTERFVVGDLFAVGAARARRGP